MFLIHITLIYYELKIPWHDIIELECFYWGSRQRNSLTQSKTRTRSCLSNYALLQRSPFLHAFLKFKTYELFRSFLGKKKLLSAHENNNCEITTARESPYSSAIVWQRTSKWQRREASWGGELWMKICRRSRWVRGLPGGWAGGSKVGEDAW